jgi:hypothetical protein
MPVKPSDRAFNNPTLWDNFEASLVTLGCCVRFDNELTGNQIGKYRFMLKAKFITIS